MSSISVSRRSLLLGGLAAGALGIAGCNRFTPEAPDATGGGTTGTDGAVTGEATVWTNANTDYEADYRRAVDAFQVKFEGQTIDLLNVADGEQYQSKLSTSAVAKTLPGVYYVSTATMAGHAEKGWISPLDDLIAESDVVDPDDFWPAVTAQSTFDGKRFVLNDDFSCNGIFVNKTLFDELGIDLPDDETWVWEDYLALAEEFKLEEGGRQTPGRPPMLPSLSPRGSASSGSRSRTRPPSTTTRRGGRPSRPCGAT